jgi:regulator of sirC expression with transglutaminase-like and TPR domain
MESIRRFAELLNSHGEAPLDELCAAIGEALDPCCARGEALRALDDLATRCPSDLDGAIEMLFGSGLFRGDVEQYHAVDNSLLHRVLARRAGMPITLSVVAIEVGRRVGIELQGVGLPGHFLVATPDRRTVIDPFARGRQRDPAVLPIEWHPATNRYIALRILNNLRHSLAPDDGDPRAFALARLRASVPEFAAENAERRRLLRHWN